MKRRTFFYSLASVLGVSGLGAWLFRNKILESMVMESDGFAPVVSTAPVEGEMCVMTTATTEGPFYVRSPLRSDVREDRVGKDLELSLQVMDYPSCTPVEGALVEIWNCDAEGNYPGYPEDIGHDWFAQAQLFEWGKVTGHLPPTNENQYLRGAQVTDAEGKVNFTTIVPLWYNGRVPHVHFKVRIEDKETLTGQLFFDQKFEEQLYAATPPYNKFGPSPVNYDNDLVARDFTEEMKGLVLRPEWREEGPVSAFAKIGLAVA